MGFGRNQLAIQKETATQRIMRSSVPLSLGEVVAKDRETIVIADRVSVAGEVRTQGYALTVICRQLTFAAGASINTSGLAGIPTHESGLPPMTQASPGDAGEEGEDGGRGGNAGSTSIFALEIAGTPAILARGGNGGRGADGGNGRKGPRGAGGNDATTEQSSFPRDSYGHAGGTGGAVGLPGRRGPGGNGGDVAIRAVRPAQIDLSLVDPKAGLPGPPAAAGGVGPGGDGGDGGRVSFRVCEYDDGPRQREQFLSGDVQWLGAVENGAATRDALREILDSEQRVGFGSTAPRKGGPESNLSAPLHQAALLSNGILRRSCYIAEVKRAPSGEAGKPGDLRAGDVAARQAEPAPGRDGVISHAALSSAELASKFDDVTLELLACDIEDQYRMKGLKPDAELKARIEFLLAICTEAPNPSGVRKEVLARAYSMARKISLGLDLYGYSLERAPLLAFESYSRLIDTTALPQAQQIENAFISYWNASDEKDKQRQSIEQSLSASHSILNNLEWETDRTTQDARKLYTEDLPAFEKKMEAAYLLLMTREAELTAAIRSKNDGCDLVGSLTAVATIVAGIASGGTGFVAAAAAGKKLYDDIDASDDSLKTLWDNKKVLGEDLKTLGEGAGKVADAIEQVRDAVGKLKPEQRKIPQFRMEREKFDEVAKEFTDLPQAEAYREAGYDYLKCVETRNQAILDYNGLLVQLIELQARKRASERTIDGLSSVMSGLYDPGEPIVIAIMNRLYLDTLALAAQMVHAERKALAYHFARPTDVGLSALNVAVITAAHQKSVLRDWVDAKERYEARRELEDGLLVLNLRMLVAEKAWESFKQTGLLSFTVRRDHPAYIAVFEGLPGLRLTGLSLELDGATADPNHQQIPWIMQHAGYEAIYRGDGRPVYFSHKAIPFRGFTPLGGRQPLIKPDFSENNLYAGVSPFASWLLSVSMNPTLGLDLSDLDRAELRLSGYMLEI